MTTSHRNYTYKGVYGKTIGHLTEVTPSKFFLAGSQLSKLGDQSLLTTLVAYVDSGDLRLPHNCVFYHRETQQTKTIRGLSTGGNFVECRIPAEFNLEGQLLITLLQNDKLFYNFLEVSSYQAPSLRRVDPMLIHGQHESFPLDLYFTAQIRLPVVHVKIDDQYYQAQWTEDHYTLNASIPHVSVLKESEDPIVFSFNKQDFFMSSIKVQYLPDLVIQDIDPKQANILTSMSLRVYAIHASVRGQYWCSLGGKLS